MRQRLVALILLLATSLFTGCWWLWQDGPVTIERTIFTPSSLIYDTLFYNFYAPDTTTVDSVVFFMETSREGDFSLRILKYETKLLWDDSGYVGAFPTKGLLDSITVDSFLFCYVIEEGAVIDEFPYAMSVFSIMDSVPLWGFTVDESTILFDTNSTSYFAPDSTVLDSLTFTVFGTPRGELLLKIDNSEYPFIAEDTVLTASVSLSSVFGTLGTVMSKRAYLVDMGDTLEDTLIYGYPSNSKILEEPFLKYAWQLGYGETMSMVAWNVDVAASANVYEAWETTRGDGITVAVIDDGFDKNHEDLAGNVIETFNVYDSSDDVTGDYGGTWHGTTVAGFIAAPSNNTGILGSAPAAKLILIKEDGRDDAKTVEAFQYAKAAGVQVINCSWGTYNVPDVISDAIQECYDAGITIVFASGNGGISLDDDGIHDESELPWVLGVGSSTEVNDVANSSNYGSNLEGIAPGQGVLGLNKMGSGGSLNQRGVVDENYFFGSGTSYACPTVSGITALLYAAKGSLTPDNIRTILITTAQKVGGSSANYVSGFDERRLYGKFDAGAATQEALTY